MEKKNTSKTSYVDTHLFHIKLDPDCEATSVNNWVKCMEKERGAIICKTIRNINYEDCRHK